MPMESQAAVGNKPQDQDFITLEELKQNVADILEECRTNLANIAPQYYILQFAEMLARIPDDPAIKPWRDICVTALASLMQDINTLLTLAVDEHNWGKIRPQTLEAAKNFKTFRDQVSSLSH